MTGAILLRAIDTCGRVIRVGSVRKEGWFGPGGQ